MHCNLTANPRFAEIDSNVITIKDTVGSQFKSGVADGMIKSVCMRCNLFQAKVCNPEFQTEEGRVVRVIQNIGEQVSVIRRLPE